MNEMLRDSDDVALPHSQHCAGTHTSNTLFHDRLDQRQTQNRRTRNTSAQRRSTTTIISSPNQVRFVSIRDGSPRGINPLTSLMMQSMLAGSPNIHEGNTRGGGGMIDEMSYDQLLSTFGDGSDMMGASENQISAMPTSTVDDLPLPEDSRQCSICLEDFQPGDKRKILPCLHGFHATCVDKWLRQNGACTICKFRIRSNSTERNN